MRRRHSDEQYGPVIALVLLGACVSDSSVGTSGGQLPPQASVSAPQSGSGAPPAPAGSMMAQGPPIGAATTMSAIPVVPAPLLVAITGEPFGRLGHSNAIVGDIDGDGLQDFVLAGAGPAPSQLQLPQPAVYVFHGKRTFPANVSVLQADAILRDPTTSAAVLFGRDTDVVQVLGDINGDGLGDFGILGLGWFRLVLGSPVRLAGTSPLAALAPGALIVADPSSRPSIYGIGDVNRDGLADLLEVDSTATASSRELRAFVISGHRDAWTPEGLRPPASLASVPFAASAQALIARSAGDMDGDGSSDMLIEVARANESFELVFYGGASKLGGALTAAQADAKLPAGVEPLADLDGDGRSELSWSEGAIVHVRYGTRERLFGEATLGADFSLRAEPSATGSALRLAVGDIDGDLTQDLLAADASEARNGAYSGTAYALHGASTRRAGTLELGAKQVILTGQTTARATTGQPVLDADQLGYGLCSGGDVSADRIDDTLVGAPTRIEGDETAGTVFLIRGLPFPPQ